MYLACSAAAKNIVNIVERYIPDCLRTLRNLNTKRTTVAIDTGYPQRLYDAAHRR